MVRIGAGATPERITEGGLVSEGCEFVELDQRFAVHGVELAWDRWGTRAGSTLTLCHGFSGSAHDFALRVGDLSGDRAVVALDHRGHGRSTKTHDVSSYTLDQLTDDFITLLDARIGGPVDLLGHSMGGQIALRTTLSRPDLVRSLILMDTAAGPFMAADSSERVAMSEFMDRFDPHRGLGDPPGDRPGEDVLIEAMTPPAWRERKAELSAGFDPFAFKGLGGQLLTDSVVSLEDRLGEIRCPVTVLAGSRDHPFIDLAPSLASALLNARLVVIDGAYHSPQLTHPHEWTQAVVDHLAWVTGDG